MSVIADPDGKIIAGPLERADGILIAEVERATITGSRFQLDSAGHYARPDVFDLRVAMGSRPFLREVAAIDDTASFRDSDARSPQARMAKEIR